MEHIVTHNIVGNLAGIKFDDFGQNAVFLDLVNFKYGNSVPQPKKMISSLQCKFHG